MAYVTTLYDGLHYSCGVAGVALTAGQVVKLSANHTFIPCASVSAASEGIAKYDCDADGAPDIIMSGVHQTDNYVGSPSAGNDLACDASTSKLKVATTSDRIVGRVIAVENGVMTFSLGYGGTK